MGSSLPILPDEVIRTILSFLPVISLLRFKYVCRSWLDLINNPDFINKEHIARSVSTNSNRMLVVSSSSNTSLYAFDLDSPESPSVQLRLPRAYEGHELKIGGSCNGVLCLYSYRPNSDVILMNPSMRQYKVIPVVGSTDHIGLGFDHENDDFKVLRTYQSAEIIASRYLKLVRRSMLYSSRTDTWTDSAEFGSTYMGRDCGILVQSHLLHWLKIESNSILRFNACDESWSELPLPPYDQDSVSTACYTTHYYLHLGNMNGCLCLYANNCGVVNIWIMKEYGVADSWVKSVDLSGADITLFLTDPPFVFSKQGGQVLTVNVTPSDESPEFYWYDFEEKTLEEAGIQGEGVPSYRGSILCWKTPARLIGGAPLGN